LVYFIKERDKTNTVKYSLYRKAYRPCIRKPRLRGRSKEGALYALKVPRQQHLKINFKNFSVSFNLASKIKISRVEGGAFYPKRAFGQHLFEFIFHVLFYGIIWSYFRLKSLPNRSI
jgi:hypothetical protein